jgi:hypothetical protein
MLEFLGTEGNNETPADGDLDEEARIFSTRLCGQENMISSRPEQLHPIFTID